jgi:peptidoglycan/xylan/chitin deacetylase (PgdA/CDA1 family)
VCLTFDFDAVPPGSTSRTAGTARRTARGAYGAEVGAPNAPDFLAERDLPATWFVPGHTIDSFPEVCERVVADARAAGARFRTVRAVAAAHG